MDRLEIGASDMNPEILLDPSGELQFIGRSMMEDASTFYAPIHQWLEAYISGGNSKLQIRCDLSYFNSSSAKQLLKVLMRIDDSELEAKVIWVYPADNDVLYDRGAELAIMVDLPFEYEPK